MSETSFRPAAEVVAQAQEAGFFPTRRTVDITEVRQLCEGVVQLTFRDAYIAGHAKPAQFVNLYCHDAMAMLPRPFGVSSVRGDEVSVIFAVIGEGTREFARLRAGDVIDVLGPLGRGYSIKHTARYVLVGGGLGIPPLLRAAQCLSEREDVHTMALLGYRDERFADELIRPYAETVDSIDDAQGNVITLLNRHESALCDAGDGLPTVILSCGPTPMMKAVAAWASVRGIDCQFSLEQRMGCGYGTCVVCVVDTVEGRTKVCSEGPVFTTAQLGWEA